MNNNNRETSESRGDEVNWKEVWVAYFRIYVDELDEIWSKWTPYQRNILFRPYYFCMACVESYWKRISFIWSQHDPVPGGAIVWFIVVTFIIVLAIGGAIFSGANPLPLMNPSWVSDLVFRSSLFLIVLILYWLFLIWIVTFYKNFSGLKSPLIKEWVESQDKNDEFSSKDKNP